MLAVNDRRSIEHRVLTVKASVRDRTCATNKMLNVVKIHSRSYSGLVDGILPSSHLDSPGFLPSVSRVYMDPSFIVV